jgi:hypothetical protein
MTKRNEPGALTEVADMIRNGISEKEVSRHCDKLLFEDRITPHLYDIMIDMILENY